VSDEEIQSKGIDVFGIGDLSKSSEKIFTKLYPDLAQPSVKKIGKALENIFGILPTLTYQLELWNGKTSMLLADNLRRYQAKLDQIPEKRVCEASPEISGPILHQMTYTRDDILAEMLTDLLLKATDNQEIDKVHPRFAKLVNEISPEEAVILKSYYCLENYTNPHVELEVNGQPQYFSELDFSDHKFQGNMRLYKTNLESLGLIGQILRLRKSSSDDGLDDSIYHNIYDKACKSFSDTDTIIRKPDRFIKLTELGELFVLACFQDKNGVK
jgi:hypothetical protein